MTESLDNTSQKQGMSPGTLVLVGDVLETKILAVDYSKENLSELPFQSIDEVEKYKDSNTVTWIIIEGLKNVRVVERIGEIFGVHRLVLEDILNTNQRPKFEEYDDYLYIVLKNIWLDEKLSVNYEQVSLLVFENVVFTFREKSDDLFKPILKRAKTSKGRLRNLGTDYLAYAILDTVVDQCFILIDSLDEKITALEDQLLSSDEPTNEILNSIQKLKREIITVRRYASPTRELLAAMLRSESGMIHERTHIYIRDVLDHTVRIIESIESYRDILSGLLDIYISSIGNKMNEVMKVLTVFASIFIPLTFLAGIYGMNFEYMPELKWKWAYPFLWVVFLVIPVGLIIYFKRKKWL